MLALPAPSSTSVDIGPGLADDLAGILFQDRALGARGVILRRFSDLLKKARAGGIVKKLGRQTGVDVRSNRTTLLPQSD